MPFVATNRLAFIIVLLATIGCFGSVGFAATPNKYETIGILDDASEGQMTPNVWAGISEKDATNLINALPDSYNSPVYTELARRLLLSSAPAFNGKNADDNSDFLIIRVKKLLAMGALRDTETLYNEATNGTPASMAVATLGLQILMLREQFPAACLDVQTLKSRFADDDLLKNYNSFCRLANDTASRDQLKQVTLDGLTAILPLLSSKPTLPQLNGLSLPSIAFGMGLHMLGDNPLVAYGPQAAQLPNLLLAALFEQGAIESEPIYGCVATEMAVRGLITTADLRSIYEHARFTAELLEPNADITNVSDCVRPALLLQRAAKQIEEPAKTDVYLSCLNDLSKQPLAVTTTMARLGSSIDPTKLDWRAARNIAAASDSLPVTKDAAPSPEIVAVFGQLLGDTVKTMPDPMPTGYTGETWLLQPLAVLLNNPIQIKSVLNKYAKNKSLTLSRNYANTSGDVEERLNAATANQRIGAYTALFLTNFGQKPSNEIPPMRLLQTVGLYANNGMSRLMRRLVVEAVTVTHN